MTSFKDIMQQEPDRKIEPGWAVKSEGEWVCYAHGYFTSPDPFYADRSKTKEEAEITVKQATEDGFVGCEIVVAWEPYCAHLLFDIERLKEANALSPSILFDLTFELENVLDTLKDAANKGAAKIKEKENDDE